MTKNSVGMIYFRKYKRVLAVLALIAILCLIGQVAVGNFVSVHQALLTIKFASFVALFGLCQMIVVSTGGNALDLSIGYIATFTAILSVRIMQGSNVKLILAILVSIAVGAFFGAINGLLVAYVNLSPLVVTMSVSTIIQGLINIYAAGFQITGTPGPILQKVIADSTGGFPNVIFVLIVVVAAVVLITNKTKYGQIFFGVGENEVAAYLSGINVRRKKCMAFILSGIVAGLIGLVLLGNMNMAFKDMGSSYVMPSYAALVVGGIALDGGEGDYLRVVLGAIFLQVLTNLFILFGGGDAVKWFGYGTVLYVLLIFYANGRKGNQW